MYQVLYCSKGGNTRKLADVIAGELGIKAEEIGHASMDASAKVIFIGSGVYAAKPSADLRDFIGSNDFNGHTVCFFSTSKSTGESAFTGVAGTLTRQGATVLRGYHCKGRAFMIFNVGHPDNDELESARKFAREIAKIR